MSKFKDPEELLLELGITLEYGYGMFCGRQVRYSEQEGIIEVGDDDFDRWANSRWLSFDIWLPRGQRQFIKWANKFKEENNG